MYLVDTNVLSSAAPTAALVPGLSAWMHRNSSALYLSVITVAEVQAGIAKRQRQGAHRKAAGLQQWLNAVLHLHGPRILPLDIGVAARLGQLIDAVRGQGQTVGLEDLAIAATAQHHGFTVLTRNLRHFIPTGIPALDPFTALPADVT